MSKRGADFRDRWIGENINADAFVHEGDLRPKQYVDRMVEDAETNGISAAELEYELTEDLEDYVRLAMDNAAMAEVNRLAEKDD